jgi:chromosome partitioning protein
MGKTIAVLNQKGGVGKTTTAVNVAAYLAKRGKSVLLVDFDPQGNATSGLGIDTKQLNQTVYDALVDESVDICNIVRPTHFAAQLHVLPSGADLAAAEMNLVSLPNKEYQLRRVLDGATHDYILIDCPPSLGILTVNALAAADYVLVPVQAEYYALEGIGQLIDVLQRVRTTIHPDVEMLGIVVTMHDKRTSLAGGVTTELQKYFGDKVCSTMIPRNVRLAEAPSHGKPISEYDSWSKGARAYKQLTKELLERMEE